MTTLIQSLARIGALQFGQFERQPGTFAPVAIHLPLLASYPETLQALADEIAPLTHIDGLTHLLVMPPALLLGVAVSLATSIPLVYPSGDHVEGAYDFNVPTVLLTDVLRDGSAEQAMIERVRGMGLDVKAIVAVFDLGVNRTADASCPVIVWRRLADVLPEIAAITPSMRAAVQRWLESVASDPS